MTLLRRPPVPFGGFDQILGQPPAGAIKNAKLILRLGVATVGEGPPMLEGGGGVRLLLYRQGWRRLLALGRQRNQGTGQNKDKHHIFHDPISGRTPARVNAP